MMKRLTFVTFVAITVSISSAYDLNNRSFPEDFKFGVSTSSYQIEGGWNADGKGPSIWDDYVHEHPEKISNNANGDVACDSYNKYTEDVELLKQLGTQTYRFSISWPRVLPNGTIQNVNQAGVDYYKNLISLLKDNNIEPIVTLYHWDLPSYLQKLGGWLNPDIVNYFGEYARFCFETFGADVKTWVTINEPYSTCYMGYGKTNTYTGFAPGYQLEAEGVYLCAYTNAKAHALAYHIYQDEFKAEQNGKIGVAFVSQWMEAASNSSEDLYTQQLALQFSIGMFAHPIFLGNWPPLMIEVIQQRSSMEGLPTSRLPAFTEDEISYIQGTYDFFGLNYYAMYLTNRTNNVDDVPGNASILADSQFTTYIDPSWNTSKSSSWLTLTPQGLERVLKWVHDTYNKPEIIITENGWSEDGSTLNDTDRIEYLSQHLSTVLDVIYDYGVNVTGYAQWSLLDNFEWAVGYTAKFGIVSVNFTDDNRTRTPKESFYWYQDVVETRCLIDECVSGASAVFSSEKLIGALLSVLIIRWLFQ